MEDKKNNELRSRREFFKKAAKGTLPILSAIVLASTPILSQAAKGSMGCNYGCAGTCYGSCAGTCLYTCVVACYENCVTTCHRTCKGGCTGTSTGMY